MTTNVVVAGVNRETLRTSNPNVRVDALQRETLVAPPPASVRVDDLQREALVAPPPSNLCVGTIIREALVAGVANTFTRSAALVREVLIGSPSARIAGLSRETLLNPVPPYVVVGGLFRETLLALAAASSGQRPVLFIVT